MHTQESVEAEHEDTVSWHLTRSLRFSWESVKNIIEIGKVIALFESEMSNTKIPTQYQYQYFWESS